MTESPLNSRHRLDQLRCLHAISELAEQRADSLPDIIRGIVELLPRCWQDPELCHVRVTFRDKIYETGGFRESLWRQVAPIRVQRHREGAVEVYYGEANSEAPFLTGEQELVDAVAAHISRVAECCLLKQELQATRQALQEAKAALRGLLSHIDEERAEIGRSINANVERVLLPHVQTLARQVSSAQKQSLALLEKGLAELSDPFAHKISSVCRNLTPTEIEICSLIRNGLSTKEIAKIRQVSPGTVFKQRENIRRKLSIIGTKENLTAHLLSISKKAAPTPETS